MDNKLQHFGVLGMKWGKRKSNSTSSKSSSKSKAKMNSNTKKLLLGGGVALATAAVASMAGMKVSSIARQGQRQAEVMNAFRDILDQPMFNLR